jgi:hypothetical protein
MKRFCYSSIGLLVLGVLLACSEKHVAPPPQPEQPVAWVGKCIGHNSSDADFCLVSIVELLGAPDLYNGKRVRVSGYVHIYFEDSGIYLHKDDLTYNLFENGLWVDLAKGFDPTQCQDSYATIEGTFKAGVGGHRGMWGVTLDNVNSCMKASARQR